MISIASILARTIASATPLALGGVGGLFGEKAGISNIGLDGTMLFGAFAAVLGSYYTGNPWIGLLCAALTGTLIAALHAYFCITLKVDHSIFGIAVNILAANITVYLSSALFGNKGYTANVTKLPSISIPVLKDIPVISAIFTDISVVSILAIIITIAGYFLLYRTRFGLHVMTVGENPKAGFTAGINVERVQYLAVMIGGFTCGLAGAYLSISYLSMFVRDMVSGRGFIAISAILFGRYNPAYVALAALFFGFTDAMQMALQGTIRIPNEIIQCMPYLLTILAVAYTQGRELKKNAIR